MKLTSPSTRLTRALQLLFLAVAVTLLYGNFLSNPMVFDDLPFFQATLPEFQRSVFSLDLRWLPYSSFRWTAALPGEELVWWRVGNLLLHITNVFVLLLLLRTLFTAVLAGEQDIPARSNTLSPAWLAFFGALIFALHPLAVFGVAYLVQRTSLMATLFALLTWWLFSAGLLRHKPGWLLASAATYLLAVLSKEHAIMVPAVCVALLFLLCQPDKQVLRRVGPTFALYGLVALFVLYQYKGRHIFGHAYEPDGAGLLVQRGIDPATSYPLSVLTQSFLYFKYVWLWLLPIPAWMSVDMPERFAAQMWSWPQTAGLIGFVLYPLVAIRWLLKRGRRGLLGFALLSPWLLFATELTTVRVQEIFVLYRSYVWMPMLFAALPFLLQKLPARYAAALLVVVTLAIVPASWNRLTIFSNPLLLWENALDYAQKKNYSRTGRMYYNRGVSYLEQEHYPQAIQDLTESIRQLPTYSRGYNERAIAYLKTGQYTQALDDYNSAIKLDPNYYNPYLGRAQVYEALGNPIAALRDYAQSCQLGVTEVCSKDQMQ